MPNIRSSETSTIKAPSTLKCLTTCPMPWVEGSSKITQEVETKDSLVLTIPQRIYSLLLIMKVAQLCCSTRSITCPRKTKGFQWMTSTRMESMSISSSSTFTLVCYLSLLSLMKWVLLLIIASSDLLLNTY